MQTTIVEKLMSGIFPTSHKKLFSPYTLSTWLTLEKMSLLIFLCSYLLYWYGEPEDQIQK